MISIFRILLANVILWNWIVAIAPAAEIPGDVEFGRDIRPVLSDVCFKCHGPDENQRQADLRFDREESVLAPHDDQAILVAGKPEQSELYLRITSNDPDLRMPPPAEKRQLTSQQIDLIKDWIKQGGQWESHWAFQTPRRANLPSVSQPDWPQNAVDFFILRRLDQEGLQASQPAGKRTLIRRVTFDITGLPPTPGEVDDFLSDDSSGAYERLVDRLLKSPRYGEHMAGDWLDAARYADTSGYQNDGPREMWRWRDWVIDAFNANQPFDEFTLEQLAGDLLPNATLAQKIATGFNRNHRGNAEGGIIAEEFQVEYVVDRVETTSTVWLGLTLGCARCHDHKYDPFSQAEFYQLFALFNNIPEHGRAVKEGNSPPYIKAPTQEQRQHLQRLDDQLVKLSMQVRSDEPATAAALTKWESNNAVPKDFDWQTPDGLAIKMDSETEVPTFVDGDPTFGKHGSGKAVVFDGKRHLNMGDVADYGYFDKFSFSFWVRPDNTTHGTILSKMKDIPRGSGYSVGVNQGKIEVNLVKRWLDDSIRVETANSVVLQEKWSHIVVTYDGTRVAAGIRVFMNGIQQPMKVNLDYINQSFAADTAPLRIGAGHGASGRFQGMIDDVRIYDRLLSTEETSILSEPNSIAGILNIPEDQRSEQQTKKIQQWFLATHAPNDIQLRFKQHRLDLRARQAYEESLPTVMVMEELPQQRSTYILKRGEYDQPGKEVVPGIPDSIRVKKQSVRNRLEFAQWLVDPQNPLTARVVVNRLWQQLFGTGLVKTTEDFGSQGELPSHRELLDWLATELVRLDWNVKELQKLIVMSATYQQSSKLTPELIQRDPENRLLARGPRRRLSARMLRDQALFVSGLLHEQLKGPSVKPYQPAGLWKEIATTTNYEQSTGNDLYRRSLYTYWKRTVAPPNMAIFDAAGREMCTVRSTQTNTPLQALVCMNDVTYLEAARALAERTFSEAGSDFPSRITHAFRLATARLPDAEELDILTNAFKKHQADYKSTPLAATELISHGASKPNPDLNPVELAALTIVAATILNLDEVITKE